ncbi:hypothetical protein KIPB_007819, partial [Kipferlia bialata]
SKAVKKGKITRAERLAQAIATQQRFKALRADTPERERERERERESRDTPVVSDKRAARSSNNTGTKRSRSTASHSGSRAASPMSSVRPVSPSARVAMSYRNPVEAAKALQGPAVASLRENPIYKGWRETNSISLSDFKLGSVDNFLFTLNVHFMSIEISDNGDKNLISGEFHYEASHAQTFVYALLEELRRMRADPGVKAKAKLTDLISCLEQTGADFDDYLMRMDTNVLRQRMEETEAGTSENDADLVPNPKAETEKKDVTSPSPSPTPSPRKIAAQVIASVTKPKRGKTKANKAAEKPEPRRSQRLSRGVKRATSVLKRREKD